MASFSEHGQRAHVKSQSLTTSALPAAMPFPLPTPKESPETALLLAEFTHRSGDAFADVFGNARGTGETEDQSVAREFGSSDLPLLLNDLRSRYNEETLARALTRLNTAWEDSQMDVLKRAVCEAMWRHMTIADAARRIEDYSVLRLYEDSPMSARPSPALPRWSFSYLPEYNSFSRMIRASEHIQEKFSRLRSEMPPLTVDRANIIVSTSYYYDLARRMAAQAAYNPDPALWGVFERWQRMEELRKAYGRRSLRGYGRKQLPSLTPAQWEGPLSAWLMASRGSSVRFGTEYRLHNLQFALREAFNAA